MKRIITLISLAIVLTMTVKAQEWDWAEDIARLNPEVIDSVIPIINPEDPSKWNRSCMIYYHQPLQHDNPSLGDISLRALFTIYSFDKFKERMVQMSIGGYKLNDLDIDNPNNQFDMDLSGANGELNFRYEGHLLRPEHRFFGTSCPENPMDKLDYCNAKEAAADFHALAEAVKKVFKGQWAITGVSKGGMCAAIQHAYYPDDADCFVPYVAPIMNSASDMRIQERSMTEPWTQEMREQMQNLVTKILNRPAVYSYYEKNNSLGPDREDECRCLFLADAYDVIAHAQQILTRKIVSNIQEENQAYLKEKGLDDYTDAMLAFFHKNKFTLLSNGFESWERDYWNKDNESETSTSEEDEDSSDFDIDIPDFDDDPSDDYTISASTFGFNKFGFYYQSLRELGYYGIKWDYFYDTQAKIDSVNAIWQSHTNNPIELNFGHLFDNKEYNPELMNLVRQQTASASKPILFIYGGDDFWTGAKIEDEYVNGDNVRRYILPEQNHDACITNMTDTEKQDEIWAFFDNIFNPQATAISNISANEANSDIYDLNGRRMNGVPERGIFLQKGKKVIK